VCWDQPGLHVYHSQQIIYYAKAFNTQWQINKLVIALCRPVVVPFLRCDIKLCRYPKVFWSRGDGHSSWGTHCILVVINYLRIFVFFMYVCTKSVNETWVVVQWYKFDISFLHLEKKRTLLSNIMSLTTLSWIIINLKGHKRHLST